MTAEMNASTRPVERSRAATFTVTILALATFGPYLLQSMRTEQAAVYGLTLLFLPIVFFRFRPEGGLRFLLPWVGYVVVATLAVIAPSAKPMPYDAGSLLGGLDNILAPLAIMLLIWSVVPERDAEGLLKRFCKIVAVAMAINGAIAILSTRVEVTDYMRPFWANEDSTTTADLAAQLGRYSGIFNLPSEAGAMYGVAGLAAIYAWSNRPALVALLVTLMTLGGLISVSKVFIFGGLPFIVIYWFWSQRGGRKVAALFGLVLIALGVVQSGLFSEWTGANYLGRLFVTSSDQGFLELYSAGRFDSDSTFNTVINQALAYNPLTGAGAAGWKIPYDGAIAEALIVGGVIGLILLSIVILSIFSLARGLDRSGQWFAFLLGAVTVAGSLGFSPLTANRISTVTWVIVTLLVLVARDRKHRTEPSDAEAPMLTAWTGPTSQGRSSR
ncbi:hypothetical protein [Zhihengliuella sp. ISTPL4]|uniref:hypothetical protein n=1 Tax=Zhihengliuella sp. ISTPL4 TaxID=2058657 RepID=UPI000C7C4D7A|nr:hypothetical protein [Zhihengliuella sp. ISTPL4]